ncbi:MAG TPA: restriction endonuclease subunit S [Pyrinomonadaceae bacterium]|jgi:type I restriction enzyme S subunit|nr:restriction endonuclease subunit S [Pyrinomonadaceae bacterium]
MDFDFPLPTGWEWVKVADVQLPERRATITGPFGSSIGMRFFVKKGVPVIRGNNLSADLTKFIDDGFVFVSEEKAKDFEGYLAKAGDIIFTAAGTLGQVGIIPKSARHPVYIISNKQMRARFDREKIEPDYAYYWFAQPAMVEYIRRQDTGSTIPLINLSVLRNLPIALPPLMEQQEIVGVLKSLDDKIELNQKMNATLEQLARELFKSWFVNFDPVKAKAAGQIPEGMDNETAALFPNELQESEQGVIPIGWNMVALDDLFDLIGGGTPKTTNPDFWNGDIPWFSVVDAPADSDVFVIDTVKKITRLGLGNCSSRLLRKGITIISARGTVGKLAIVATPMAMNQSCYALDGNFGDYFTYYSTKRALAMLRQNTHGAVFETITRGTFKTVNAILPPIQICQAFERYVSPIMHRIESNLRQSHVLAEIRNMLLPRLISGQLRIPGNEQGVFNEHP